MAGAGGWGAMLLRVGTKNPFCGQPAVEIMLLVGIWPSW